MNRAAIVEEARSWIDPPTRWVHQACCKGVGVDCLHFIAGVARNVGVKEAEQFFATPEWHNYGRHPDPTMMFVGCDGLMDRIPVADARSGDVFVLRCGRYPMHFGIFVEPDKMIHAYVTAGRVVEDRLKKWRVRIVRAYRLRGIE